MNINIKVTNFNLTPEVRRYLEGKLNRLSKKFLKALEEKGAITAQAEIARLTRHHQKGDIYYTELNLSLPGKILRAEGRAADILSAINEADSDLKRQVQRYRDVRSTLFKKGARLFKKLIRGI